MALEDAARTYKDLGEKIKLLTAERKAARTEITQTMGDLDYLELDNGLTITKFRKTFKKLSIENFKKVIETYGVGHLYTICNVVQTRMSADEKALLEPKESGVEEIRVC